MAVSWCDSVDGGVEAHPCLAADVIPAGTKKRFCSDLQKDFPARFKIVYESVQSLSQSNQTKHSKDSINHLTCCMRLCI